MEGNFNCIEEVCDVRIGCVIGKSLYICIKYDYIIYV